MEKYICTVCDYVYDPELGDPENGIEPGTSFEDLPEDCAQMTIHAQRYFQSGSDHML